MLKKILFLCNHNAGRSQMAEAFFNEMNKDRSVHAESAGTKIASEVNPTCVEAMKEIGIDLSDTNKFYPKVVDVSKEYDEIYTMGCNVSSPLPVNKDLDADDPAGKEIDEVRKIRDLIKKKIEALI